MCERFAQVYTWQEAHEFYNLTCQGRNLQPKYNLAPTQSVNVIITGEAGPELQDMRWGLIPNWWKRPLKDLPSTFNAKSETAAAKLMFRAAFKRNRCLVPASGFYEWCKSGDTDQPYYVAMADGSPMTFTGLWELWSDPETGEDLKSCTILTTEPNGFMKAIHNRMPVILKPEQFDAWLNEASDAVFKPCRDELLTAHPVPKAVENVSINSPDLLLSIY